MGLWEKRESGVVIKEKYIPGGRLVHIINIDHAPILRNFRKSNIVASDVMK